MSNKALSYVFEHSKTKGSARVLMLAIADMANDEGECWPGKARLEKKINITLRNVIKLVQQCERMGELAVIERPDTTNRYVIVGLAKDDRLKGARAPRDKWTPAEKLDTGVNPDTTVTSDTPTTVNGDSTTLVSSVTPNPLSSNPKHNPQPTNTSRAGKAPAAVRTEPQSYATTSGKSDAELLATRDAVETEMRIDDDRRLHRNEQRALLLDMVAHLFKVSGPFAQKYVAMLEGRQLQNIRANAAWNEAAAYLKGAPVSADELYGWSKWYRQTILGGNEKLSLTSKPESLVSSILAYRETPTTTARATGMFAGTNYDDTYWERQDAAKASAK